jgi:RNA methyltransferase, TrmH family
MITSTQNPLVKQVRRLKRDRRAREEERLFVVEGIQGVVEAVQSGAELHALLYSPERLTSEIAEQAIATASARGVRCEPLSAELFKVISERENPVGIAALVARRLARLDDLEIGEEDVVVALEGISDPGNLGTILRTADATGTRAILLVGQTVDPFHPSVVKASAGTLFTVPVVMVPDIDTLLSWSARSGVGVVATSDRAEAVYWSVPYRTPLLFLMGSEAQGLPEERLAALPVVVRIPMEGIADSLNLGVATALVLYEARRQRQYRGS